MRIEHTSIPEVVIVHPQIFRDARGYFFESFNERTFESLVGVIRGRVLDIAVDIRVGSPTFGRWAAAELSGENASQLFIPRGFAHGFSVLSDEAVFQYKCDGFYNPSAEGAIAWDDPDLAIDWGLPAGEVLLSEKDKYHPRLKDIPAEELFVFGADLY